MPYPGNGQSYNRYSYANNNPLSHVDPTGHFHKKIFKGIRKIVRGVIKTHFKIMDNIPVNRFTNRLLIKYKWARQIGQVAATFFGGPWGSAAFAAHMARISGGSYSDIFRAAVTTYITGIAFNAVGDYYGKTWNPRRVLTHSVVGGASAKLQGGRFKDGFKFAGLSAAARYLYNSVVKYDTTWKRGGDAVEKHPTQMPIEDANNIGTQGGRVDPSGWWNEGGRISRFLNKVPGVNAVAGLHDVFQINLDRAALPMARNILNIPGMPIAVGITYTALIDGVPAVALAVDRTKRR